MAEYRDISEMDNFFAIFPPITTQFAKSHLRSLGKKQKKGLAGSRVSDWVKYGEIDKMLEKWKGVVFGESAELGHVNSVRFYPDSVV